MKSDHTNPSDHNYTTAVDGNKKPQITKLARSLQRSDTHEILYSKAQEWSAKHEELRKQKSEKELSNIRPPQINQTSKAMVERSGSFTERLVDSQRHRELHIAQLKDARVQESVRPYTMVPEINPVSQRMDRSVNSLLEWGERKAARLAEARAAEDDRTAATGRPKISKRSSQIVERKRATGIPMARVEDRLLASARPRTAEPPRTRARPAISVHAAHTMLAGDVSNRLYDDAKRQRDRRDKLTKAAEDATMSHVLTSPRRPSSATRARVEDELIRSGEERTNRLRRAREEQDEALVSLSGIPKINPTSNLIAASSGRATTPLTDRLTQPIHHLKQSLVTEVALKSSEYTFKPTINTLSEKIDSASKKSKPRVELMVEKHTEFENKMDALRRQAAAKEMEECSFQPAFSSRRLVLNGNIVDQPHSQPARGRLVSPKGGAHHAMGRMSNTPEPQRMTVFDRQLNWRTAADKKLASQRAKKSRGEMAECTFRPTLVASPKRSPSPKVPATRRSASARPGGAIEEGDDNVSRTLSIVDSILARENEY